MTSPKTPFVPGGFASPADVPMAVTDAELTSALQAGRLAGAEQTRVQLAGVTCPVTSSGGGRPMIFVHGLGHDSWDFAPLMHALARTAGTHNTWRLIAPDMPGFGLADKQLPQWELHTLVDALVQLAQLQDSTPVVVASSLGAHVAILAALQHPQLFHKLVLLAPGGLVEVGPLLAATLRGHYSVESIVHRSEADVVATSRRIFANQDHPLCQRLAARKLAIHRSVQRRTFAVPFSGYVDDVFRHVVQSRVQQLRMPVLFISGAQDVVVPPAACATAAQQLGARFVALPGVGHTPHLEATDMVVDLVHSFAGAA
jgi:pimeloyl-ACP methyl ester carboxylesterase